MGKINVLDRFTAEKIAAGEVVEKPASVIKELVENSIDAGARSITVEIKNGGITYMRVTDDGGGMEPDDAETAFLRHATSKIKTDKDLEAIGTLGFRGEALCSIAAVSRTELYTKRPCDEAGTYVFAEGGVISPGESAGCPDGTTIVVRDLFFNTPARMKFLKKDSAEAASITDVCNKQALSHPDVSIRLIRDGKEVLFTPGDNILKNAVHCVLGKEIAANMTEVSFAKDGIKVTGLTGKNNLSRPNRLMEIFFVNGRCVANKTLYAALAEGYKNELMIGKFPVAVLNIEMDASLVDVNVHPGKTEVKFASEGSIYEAVYWAVKSALQKNAAPRSVITPTELKSAYKMPVQKEDFVQTELTSKQAEKPSGGRFRPYEPKKPEYKPPVPTENEVREAVKPYEGRLPVRAIEGADSLKTKAEVITEEKPQMPEIKTAPEIKTVQVEKQENPIPEPVIEEKRVSVENFRIIGQLFSTYILAEMDGEFIVTDQHAAHERIRYEEIKASGNKADSQMLLMPLSVNLAPEEYETWQENEEFLSGMGFDAEDFGGNALVIRALPADCPYEDGSDLFIEMLSVLRGNEKSEISEKRDRAVYTVACKGAIKANKEMREKELSEIFRRAFELEGISTCPHGRPISIKLTKYQIEKMFGRIGKQ